MTSHSLKTIPTASGAARLVERLPEEGYGIVFAGQGFDWLETLAQAIAQGASSAVAEVCAQANELLAPVADELDAITTFGFEPLEWATKPPAFNTAEASVSVPGILVAQLATLQLLESQGLNLEGVPAIGHSQGVLGAQALEDLSTAGETLALARIIGAAMARQSRVTGLITHGAHRPMVSVVGVSRERLQEAIDAACAGVDKHIKPVIGLKNARDIFVLVGRPRDNALVIAELRRQAAREQAEVENKKRGGAAFDPRIVELPIESGFHHPAMADAVEQVARWAKACGLGEERARELAQKVLVDPVDWPHAVSELRDGGATWLLDVGPGDGVFKLSNMALAGTGAASIAVASLAGQSVLFDAGNAPSAPLDYSEFAPRLKESPDGRVRLSTKFSELTGRSPMLLAGMTPTTVDPEIVAAAANAGHWAELAGGGQVTPQILEGHVAKLRGLLNEGVAAQFNSMFLDPYLWKMQIEGKRLIPKARANGAPIDGIVITAGMPEQDAAVELVADLHKRGFSWVAFKPGTVRQVEKVLQVAAAVDTPIILQLEGGKAGGHHSWEDLDELLIATYAQIRAHRNVVLCVGGGIGTPERAADYLLGTWAKPHGLVEMPVDGILIGTAAMACKEAKTSPAVKQMLADTKGIEGWVGAGEAAGGMASGRSQLGADIHEIDNSFARAGRLLDEVAGDAEAVAARREEIIAAIAKTAKPYFGDLEEMSYGQWLRRYLELSGPWGGNGWLDVSWFNRFAQMVERTQARLVEQDHGEFSPAVVARVEDDAAQIVEKLGQAVNLDTLMHPADRDWFLSLARTRGKPVNFVPVIDKDVRRWWRSDSLWQAHDPRYSADEVAIIPGISAVAGIERVDEPVGELLDRFNAESIKRLEEAGADVEECTEENCGVLHRVIAAPATYWAGRHAPSLIARLGSSEAWQIAGEQATHEPTGARLEKESDTAVVLSVPLAAPGTQGQEIRVRITDQGTPGVVPQVTQADAEEAMGVLLALAAGGQLGETVDGEVRNSATLELGDLANYMGVTAAYLPENCGVEYCAPDILVGKAWPSVFAAIGAAEIPGLAGASVVEGMLSLVHLEHHVTLQTDLEEIVTRLHAGESLTLDIKARAEEVSDTEIGRIVVVRAEITSNGTPVAKLSERMAIRGRGGEQTARINTSALPTHVDAPRSFRAHATVTAPSSMRSFALVTGDRNPIHVSDNAAKLAGLPEGVIVHGMWTSAIAELVASASFENEDVNTPALKVREFTATMLAPVLPGQELDILVERSAVDTRAGHGEVREVVVSVAGSVVLTAVATMAAPRTFYAFPGQGIQSPGMGGASRARSSAARAVWERADKHSRTKLGFSILEIVENNPTSVVVDGETFTHPKGVLYLTQFTQVGMACLGVAQIAEMREKHALNQTAYFAGHSVGEYNALAAYADVLSLENVIEIVYQRGLTMHRLVERNEQGVSNYGLAALRPNKISLSATEVFGFVEEVAASSGEFLEIVNYNLAGLQYAVAGTTKGLAALEAACEKIAPGQRAYIRIPGIDVPFHSTHLLGGVDAFREHLDELIPQDVNLDTLVGRYVPNLVARPFELSEDFARSILDVVDAPIVRDIVENFSERAEQPVALARTLLVELLAWQFASPVRWIETQDLICRSLEDGGLGVERFVEVGVASAPTLANMMAQTLSLPQYANASFDVWNVERDFDAVFAADEIRFAQPDPEADATAATGPDAESGTGSGAAGAPAPVEVPTTNVVSEPAAPAGPSGAEVADIAFSPADATEMLIAVWTKVRTDQMAPTDSIEALVEGVSSRRNQLLLDLGVEFGLGAIDGAADAELKDLYATISKQAKGYQAFGPVLSETVGDSLRRITGPSGKRPAYISERVTGTWQLGAGWANQVIAAIVLGARDGASLRGGDLAVLAPAAPSSAAELDQLIDAAVQAVAAKHGVSVAMPQAGGSAGAVVDSAALEVVTGKQGVLAATARTILDNLGLNQAAGRVITAGDEQDNADDTLIELFNRELGSDWARQVAPSFDERKAVLLDDRWASAREDLSRVALGIEESTDVTGAGEEVARQAEYLGLKEYADQARDTAPGEFSRDVAVVTGGSPNSIAAAVIAKLLRGGATVVATTSSLSHQRLGFYKELYREHARGAAQIWVVPANLSSFSDLDALVQWIGSEQTATVNGASTLVKPALKPTLLFPFAAPRVTGSLLDAGASSELQMRLLLHSVERLIAGLSQVGTQTHVGQRLHVVLPGSPNRGRFGGDGAYGESKAALDALVTRWHAEPAYRESTSLAHALIGWVRGTGLMGGNDPLVEAVEAAGVRTYSTEEIADKLIELASADSREAASEKPVVADFTGGLGEADLDLAQLARENRKAAPAAEEEQAQVAALPTPRALRAAPAPSFGEVSQSLEDMVVIVGAGELGPYGSMRTRFEAELSGDLSAAGVVELAWSMGLISYDTTAATPGWVDAEENPIAEEEIFDRFHDEVLARVGVRRYHDDFGMVNNLAPELTSVYTDHDITFAVADEAAARTFVDSDPEQCYAVFDEEAGEWLVTRKAGSEVRVPRRMAMSRFVGGQIPEGFDPAVYGIPADMVDNLDRVALWNIVATVEAFISSGFSPAELLANLHPTRVSSTQGTGLGGMQAMRSLYIDGLLAEPRPNDILQEALPNVMAAHVMQSYVGGYGQMVHPVAACATAAVSVEEGVDKIRLGKSDFVVAGGYDDLSIEGITGFGDMAATADSQELADKGIEDRYFSRANDRRRAGFVESAGGGTVLLARASLAADLGLPVLGVVGFAESFADGAHTSIPAPGLGALGAARGGVESRFAKQLAALDVAADDIAVVSKHDTSTNANDPNESDLHERIASAIGRSAGNPLYVISQKTLTGHAKGGAAAFQIIGLAQVLGSAQIPANRSLDCVDPVLRKHEHLVWLRRPLSLPTAPKAGLVTSLGFGHVSALLAIVHPEAFIQALRQERGEEAVSTYRAAAAQREESGARRITAAIYGGAPLYTRPVDRNLGATGAVAKEREAAMLLDSSARLVDGYYQHVEVNRPN